MKCDAIGILFICLFILINTLDLLLGCANIIIIYYLFLLIITLDLLPGCANIIIIYYLLFISSY